MDELRVWSTARTPTQIATYYNKVITSREIGSNALSLNWHFDEDTDTASIASDDTDKKNDGKIGGLPLIKVCALNIPALPGSQLHSPNLAPLASLFSGSFPDHILLSLFVCTTTVELGHFGGCLRSSTTWSSDSCSLERCSHRVELYLPPNESL